MKRLEIRFPDEVFDKIWEIHSETRKSLQEIILKLVKKGLEAKK